MFGQPCSCKTDVKQILVDIKKGIWHFFLIDHAAKKDEESREKGQ